MLVSVSAWRYAAKKNAQQVIRQITGAWGRVVCLDSISVISIGVSENRGPRGSGPPRAGDDGNRRAFAPTDGRSRSPRGNHIFSATPRPDKTAGAGWLRYGPRIQRQ